ncbi:Uu.00g088370.m01.CDS01 [Anthostomella pinea]|uniref:Uu.00g088370.m01.CDS01 n=1 Tax=Anthostomella pinea TaxID=933095 RepID=A0AAI8YJY8_9PEZI|nr:Uu.00g088370.m01.CDS01 [Anthostomella pinea]
MALFNLIQSALGLLQRHPALATVVILITYVSQLAVRRLYLSPISHIPGPKLAALTWAYEFYYDIILGGQYTFNIIDLHREYGPIIRINPYEIHVADPDFFSEVYPGPTRPRDKWSFFTSQFGAPDSTVATVDHNLHRVRRAAMNPFFSMSAVRKLQPVIEERVDALLERFKQHSRSSDEPLDLMYPYSAYTNDVICEYAFSRCNKLVEDPNYGRDTTDSLLDGTRMGNTIKHMPWLLALANQLPESLTGRYIPGWNEFLKLKASILDQTLDIQSGTTSSKRTNLEDSRVPQHPTIFHEMLSSRLLPPAEKTPQRIAQEGQILVQAGTMTTSWALTVGTFHLLNNPSSLKLLRDELFAALPDPSTPTPFGELMALPYLRAVVTESIRLSVGASSRLARISPTETLEFHDKSRGRTWRIPPGTPVGMTWYQTLCDPAVFAKPLAFRPERWLDDNHDDEGKGKHNDRYMVAFGGGTRVCLGMNVAQAELHLMLAKLFRRWGGGPACGNDNNASEADGDEKKSTCKGDRRPGDLGFIRVHHETTARDCQMAADYFTPIPWKGSKGVRVVFEAA